MKITVALLFLLFLFVNFLFLTTNCWTSPASDKWMEGFYGQLSNEERLTIAREIVDETQHGQVSPEITVEEGVLTIPLAYALVAYLLIGIVLCFSVHGQKNIQKIILWPLWLIIEAVDHGYHRWCSKKT